MAVRVAVQKLVAAAGAVGAAVVARVAVARVAVARVVVARVVVARPPVVDLVVERVVRAGEDAAKRKAVKVRAKGSRNLIARAKPYRA